MLQIINDFISLSNIWKYIHKHLISCQSCNGITYHFLCPSAQSCFFFFFDWVCTNSLLPVTLLDQRYDWMHRHINSAFTILKDFSIFEQNILFNTTKCWPMSNSLNLPGGFCPFSSVLGMSSSAKENIGIV